MALTILLKPRPYENRIQLGQAGFGCEPSFDELLTGESFPYLEVVIKES